MTRVSTIGGGAQPDLFIQRRLKSRNDLEAVQRAVSQSLNGHGRLFVPRPVRLAHVSLLDSNVVEHVLETTKRGHKLRSSPIVPRVRAAMPSSSDEAITAKVARIKPIQALGKGGCLAVVFDCPEL